MERRWICSNLGSLPVRERGLKHLSNPVAADGVVVAPRAGAWIEASREKRVKEMRWPSLLVRERGLKPRWRVECHGWRVSLSVLGRGLKRPSGGGWSPHLWVALRAGAWIEAHQPAAPRWGWGVAPRAGAWIEASVVRNYRVEGLSLPVRERGLKPLLMTWSIPASRSLPVRERGLKRHYRKSIRGVQRRSPCGSVD